MESTLESNPSKRQKIIRRTSIGIALLAVMHISAIYEGNRVRVYVTKPVTMLAIMLVATMLIEADGAEHARRYGHLILAGLTCSLVGDVFLMLPSQQFVAGLASFLVAHLFYITGFRTGLRGVGSLWLALPFYAFGALALWLLLPGLGVMKLPVLIYLVVILTMAWQALYRWRTDGERRSLYAFSGAILFVASDSLIAFNRFRSPFRLAEGLIMGAYFCAQWLIALSV